MTTPREVSPASIVFHMQNASRKMIQASSKSCREQNRSRLSGGARLVTSMHQRCIAGDTPARRTCSNAANVAAIGAVSSASVMSPPAASPSAAASLAGRAGRGCASASRESRGSKATSMPRAADASEASRSPWLLKTTSAGGWGAHCWPPKHRRSAWVDTCNTCNIQPCQGSAASPWPLLPAHLDAPLPCTRTGICGQGTAPGPDLAACGGRAGAAAARSCRRPHPLQPHAPPAVPAAPANIQPG